MRNLDELLERAKNGKLSQTELDHIIQKIKDSKPGDDDDLYSLIHILGKARIFGLGPPTIEEKKLLEKFLYYPQKPMISKIALQTLCNYWDLNDNYLKELKMFVRGVEWDDDEIVRTIAISIAGDFLKTTLDKELLKLLIDIFENKEESKLLDHSISPEITQGCAYQALSIAMGKSYREFIIELSENNCLDMSVLQKAHELLNKNS